MNNNIVRLDVLWTDRIARMSVDVWASLLRPDVCVNM